MGKKITVNKKVAIGLLIAFEVVLIITCFELSSIFVPVMMNEFGASDKANLAGAGIIFAGLIIVLAILIIVTKYIFKMKSQLDQKAPAESDKQEKETVGSAK